MKSLRKIIDFFNVKKHVNQQLERLTYAIRSEKLNQISLTSKESGVSEARYADSDLIVSMTSYGKRLLSVSTTIESIMQGTVKPNRIILWLDSDMKEKALPVVLQNQIKRGLEVYIYEDDIKSYKKLIPALEKYPESIIITIDDDAIYDYDLVETLLKEHLQSPNEIIANRVHQVIVDKNNRPISYNEWRWEQTLENTSNLNFLTGIGGVLYPPHCLDNEVFNKTEFVKLCKYADDIWFYSMAIKKGTCIKKTITRSANGIMYVLNDDVQSIGLGVQNVGAKRNDIQLKTVFDRYDLYSRLLH